MSGAFSRLEHARKAGIVDFLSQTQEIILFRPNGQLPDFFTPDFCTVLHSFFPDVAALSKAGFQPVQKPNSLYSSSIVALQPAQALNDQMIASAISCTKPGGMVVVEGAKNEGIDSVYAAAKTAGLNPHAWSKFHGKVIWFTPTPQSAWVPRPPRKPEKFQTRPGVFSAKRVDPGSDLLTKHIAGLTGAGADLGAGWGMLSHAALAQNPKISKMTLIEAELNALEAAKENIQDTRAFFEWNDVTRYHGGPFHFILMNPPFHSGKVTKMALGVSFIRAAARLLAPKGQLRLVANQHLPYERILDEIFSTHKILTQEGGYKILRADFPKSKKVMNESFG